MATRITIYGKTGDKNTERLRREMRVMSMEYHFQDVAKNPASLQRLAELGEEAIVLPKVEVTLPNAGGSVFLLKSRRGHAAAHALFGRRVRNHLLLDLSDDGELLRTRTA